MKLSSAIDVVTAMLKTLEECMKSGKLECTDENKVCQAALQKALVVMIQADMDLEE